MRLPQKYLWRDFKSCRTLHCIDWWIFTDVSKYRCSYIFGPSSPRPVCWEQTWIQ